MDFQLIVGLLLTIIPIAGLRIGLPLVVDYCLREDIPIFPFFLLVVLLNVLMIFVIYFFLEKIHHGLLKWEFYAKVFNKFIEKLRNKTEKLEKRFNEIGYLALVLFVAIPLPGTGTWAGTLLAWLVGLDKKKSISAIALGVVIAGLIILLSSFGVIGLFYR